MSLLDEARRQLEAELQMYIRCMQPVPVIAHLSEKGGGGGVKMKAMTAAKAKKRIDEMASGNPHPATTATGSNSHSSTNPKARQARIRLEEVVKKLQCAVLVAAQVSSAMEEEDAHAPSVAMVTASVGGTTAKDASSMMPAAASSSLADTRVVDLLMDKQLKGAAATLTAAAKRQGKDSGRKPPPANADHIEEAATLNNELGRMTSPPATRHAAAAPSRSSSAGSSSPSRGGRHRLASTIASTITARSPSPNSGPKITSNASANLRRLGASLTFAEDCLHFATVLAEAGLGSDALTFFLRRIAQDVTGQYETILTRCVELPAKGSGDSLLRKASVEPSTAPHADRRHSAGPNAAGGRDERKPTPAMGGADAPKAMNPGEIRESNTEECERVSDGSDVFAAHPPLPLALRIHKCVMRYHALMHYIRFGEVLAADLNGDAVGMSTALDACACVEQLVALQQRVLCTPYFSAANVLRREALKLEENINHGGDGSLAKSVSTVMVGGCRVTDLVAEPLPFAKGSTTLATPSVALPLTSPRHAMHSHEGDEERVHAYAVEGVAAPVLLSTRLYVVNMCRRLLAHLRDTGCLPPSAAATTAAMAVVGDAAVVSTTTAATVNARDVANGIIRRLIEALRTSLSMSELHYNSDRSARSPLSSSRSEVGSRSADMNGGLTCLPLATVDFLPWRLQEYALLQYCYGKVQEDPLTAAAAVAAAQRALSQVLQLTELEYLDPVPPPASSAQLLEWAVQRCAAQLLVTSWRAMAFAPKCLDAALQLALCEEALAKPLGEGMNDVPVASSTRVSAAAALAALCNLVQITVTPLLGRKSSATSRPSSPEQSLRSTLRGPGNGPVTFGGSNQPWRLTGTRLLVVLWMYFAQVQQHYMLLTGKVEAAEALWTAATINVNCEDSDARSGAGSGNGGAAAGSSPLPSGLSPPQDKGGRKGKGGVTAAGNKNKIDKGLVDATQQGGDRSPVVPSCLPATIAHSNPSVVALASVFPGLALEVLVELTCVSEAAGVVPQYSHDPSTTGMGCEQRELGAGQPLGEPSARSGKNVAGGAGKDAVDRKPVKTNRSRNSSMMSANPLSSDGVGAYTEVQLRGFHTVYHCCVEALEILLHGAAVKASGEAQTRADLAVTQFRTSSPCLPATTAAQVDFMSRLGARTYAAVLRAAESTLGLQEGLEILLPGKASGGGSGKGAVVETPASAAGGGEAEERPHLVGVGGPQSFHAPSQPLPQPQLCFLYNPADARCLARTLSWDALFSASSNTVRGPALCGATDIVDSGAARSVVAYRTLTLASPRPCIVVRIGVALESWWRMQLSPQATADGGGHAASATATATTKTKHRNSPDGAMEGERKKKHHDDGTGQRPQVASSSSPSSSSTQCSALARAAVMETCARCTELLYVLVLQTMLQQRQQRKGDGALTSTLHAFAAVDRALHMEDLEAAPAAGPPQTAEQRMYAHLYALSQVTERHTRLQRIWPRKGLEASLREFSEVGARPLNSTAANETAAGAPSFLDSALPPSLHLYRAVATFLETVAEALCPLADSAVPMGDEPGGNYRNGNGGGSLPVTAGTAIAAGGLCTPMMATLPVLQPVVADVASHLLRCCSELHTQWQRHRAHRQVRQAAILDDDVIGKETAVAPPASLSMAEREADEEAMYASVVLSVVTSVWHSGSTGNGDANLRDEWAVAELASSVEAGFLQLIPALPGSTKTPTSVRAGHISLQLLVRLIAHGVTVRRLADRVRMHFQRRVESLLTFAEAAAKNRSTTLHIESPRPHGLPQQQQKQQPTKPPRRAPAVLKRGARGSVQGVVTAGAATTQVSEKPILPLPHQQLDTVRDALTEQTYMWFVIRWHLARLQAHQKDYAAQLIDMETLQGRQEQQQVYGRTTAKELRVLRALEQSTPALPVTAKAEEARLRRWVAEQRQSVPHAPSHAPTVATISLLLLDALVCTALVPLNSADPSAQQALLEEAIRWMRQAEEGIAKKSLKRSTSLRFLKGPAPASADTLVWYTPLLLWCYISDACNIYGTREQAERVRAVLDAHVLRATPAVTSYRQDGDANTGTLITTSFLQRLLLQPKWPVLQGCSAMTRLAYCRALSSMAAATTGQNTSSGDALSSLRSAYRLLLALRIQRFPPATSEVRSATDHRKRCAVGTGGAAGEALAAGQGESSPSSSAAAAGVAAFTSSPLAIETAQQLVCALSQYLARNHCGAGTAAAPLLLPPLVALCEVLLGLPSSSPQWADAAVQLLAVRVLSLFHGQLKYVLSPLMTVSGVVCAAPVSEALLRLLWLALTHVWNSVYNSPNPRQCRVSLAAEEETHWARRVLEGHHRLMQQQEAADAAAAAEAGQEEKNGRAVGGGRAGARNTRVARGISPDSAANAHGGADPAAPPPASSLENAGALYLASEGVEEEAEPETDGEGKPDKNDGARANDNSLLSPLAASTSAAKHGPDTPCATVLMHANIPADLMEVMEEILYHTPALWPVIFGSSAPVSSEGSGGGTDMERDGDGGNSGGVVSGGTITGAATAGASKTLRPPKDNGEGEDELLLIQNVGGYLSYAAQYASRLLRSFPLGGAGSTTPAHAPSTKRPTALFRLHGVPAVYPDVAVALHRYSLAVHHSITGGGGGSAAPVASSTRAGGTSRGLGGGGGNGGSQNSCGLLLDVLSKYKRDPAYAKLAVHVVRQMLACCSDAEDLVGGGGAGGSANGITGGAANTSNSTSGTSSSRKRNVGAGSAAATADATTLPITARSTAVAAASAVLADVRLLLRTVRDQASETHRSLEAYLAAVDQEARRWLTRGGYGVGSGIGAVLPSPTAPGGTGDGGAPSTLAAGGVGGGGAHRKKMEANSAAAASHSSSARKKKQLSRGNGGKIRKGGHKSPSGDVDGGEVEDEEEEAHNAANGVVPYTVVTRVWSFVEQQKLKQITYTIALWRRRRAARTLRRRYTRFNMPFMAELHVYEAALLHMGVAAQRTVASHERTMQELLRFAGADGAAGGVSSNSGGCHVGLGEADTRITTATTAREKPAKSTQLVAVAETADDSAPAPGSLQTTIDLLSHCSRACFLFQYLWLPARAAAAAQLAMRYLQDIDISKALRNSRSRSSGGSGSEEPSKKLMELLQQLLMVPLFALAAVQCGYCDACRDVHADLLQPSVMKVGRAVSWTDRFHYHRTVPSLLSLVSPLGQREEQQAAQQAQEEALRLRRYEELQLRLCVDEEAVTRAEAEADELRAKVCLWQQVQDALPAMAQNAALKEVLLAAADLLSSTPDDGGVMGSHQWHRSRSPPPPLAAGKTEGRSPTREHSHAAPLAATASLHFFTFAGARRSGERSEATAPLFPISGVSVSGTAGGADGPQTPSSDATKFGNDMREATLMEQLTFFTHLLAPLVPNHIAMVYRVAHHLTGGRYAGLLLPLILRMEEATRGETTAESQKAYDEAMRNIPQGLLLLRAARTARAQWWSYSSREPAPFPSQRHSLAPLGGRPSLRPTEVVSDGCEGEENLDSAPPQWRTVAQLYQQAARELRGAGLLQPLGECLLEQGDLYNALGRVGEAARRWSDALDCFLCTPHTLEDWHLRRATPPPPSNGRRTLEELLWITAALTALATKAFPFDHPRATAATLLCAHLLHHYWRLSGVTLTSTVVRDDSSVMRFRGSKGIAAITSSSNSTGSSPMPLAQYSLVLAQHVGAPARDALRQDVVGANRQRAPTGMPAPLQEVVRRVIHSAQYLLAQPVSARYSGEAAVLSAFGDFVATMMLRSVDLAVDARLVRAAAAAQHGAFSTAMRLVYGVSVGAGLPQRFSSALGAKEELTGYFSIESAAAATAVFGTAGAAVAATVIPGSGCGGPAVALTSFYRDEESPLSPHNTAAVRAFVTACLPGLPSDMITKFGVASSNGGGDGGATMGVSLTNGVIASAALEERCGPCLVRRLHLTIAELLVRLGTCDSSLLLTPYTFLSAAAAATSSSSGGDYVGLANSVPSYLTSSGSPSVATAAANSGGGRHQVSSGVAAAAAAVPRSGSGSSSRALPTLAPTGGERGEQQANACTEACGYARVLLQSLATADPYFVLTGQAGACNGSESGGVGRPSSGAAGSAASQGPKLRVGATARAATSIVAIASAPEGAQQTDTVGDGSNGGSSGGAYVAEFGTLGAIRQCAIVLAAELLSAQGQCGVCVRLLKAIVCEYNDTKQQPSKWVDSTRSVPLSSLPGPLPPPQQQPPPTMAAVQMLKGHGFEPDKQAGTPLVFPYAYWVRVWLLICRCYSHQRRYAALEEAARTQGLSLCATFGVEESVRAATAAVGKATMAPSSVAASGDFIDLNGWTPFQLYRVYALMQLGRLQEAADVMMLVQSCRDTVAPGPSAVVESSTVGLSEDACLRAVALQWWGALDSTRASSLVPPRQVLAQLVHWAVAEHGVLPWQCAPSNASSSEASPGFLLVTPAAFSVLPALPISRAATTRFGWKLHDVVNGYILAQLQQLQEAPAHGTRPPGQRTAMASYWKKRRGSGGSLSGESGGNGGSDSAPTNLSPSARVQAENEAKLWLGQALETISPQYDISAHAGCWLETQLWAARLKVREVCLLLQGGTELSEEGAMGNLGRGGSAGSGNSALSMAVVGKGRSDVASSEHTLLMSREETLQVLPSPVRDVCDQLIGILHRSVALPVQRHALVRMVLLDLARVLTTYVRVRRSRQRLSGTPYEAPTPFANPDAGIVAQLESIAAACTLLAGLVSDMERRMRTGADTLRGYATDPRVEAATATASGINQTGPPETPWPESLMAALQRTFETVGRLPPSTIGDAAAPPSARKAGAQPLQQQVDASVSPGGAGAVPEASSSTLRRASASHSPQSGAVQGGAVPASLSVPIMAMTYTTLCDEATAARALLPVTDALERDLARQLLTRHLQRLSSPVNCTYLCYCDTERQALLESIGVILSQQLQLQQQQQSTRRVGSGGHSRRTGGAATPQPGAAAAGAGGVAASSIWSESDVWKALAPPLLLSAVPTGLFTSLGTDVLGAPLYNSVAAASLCVMTGTGSLTAGAPQASPTDASRRPRSRTGGSACIAQAGGSTAGAADLSEVRWQLYLCVSPLQDNEVAATAPSLTPQTVASSLDNCALLPPQHLVAAAAAVAGIAEGGGAGTGGSNTPSTSTAPSRARLTSRQSVTGGHSRRLSTQAVLSGVLGGGGVGGTDRGAWWPPIPTATCSTPAHAALVPSTNWAFFDSIQLHQQQHLSQPLQLLGDAEGLVKSVSIVLPPHTPATRGSRKAGPRSSPSMAGSGTAGSVSSGPPGSVGPISTTAVAANAAASHVKADLSAPRPGPSEPSPLRWRCISIELSGSTVLALRRYLHLVRACMRRMETEDGSSGGLEARDVTAGRRSAAEEATGIAEHETTRSSRKKDEHPPATPSASVAAATAGSGNGMGGPGGGDAGSQVVPARSALAAAVAQAQGVLRARLLAGNGGVAGAAGGSGVGLNGGSLALSAQGAADNALRGSSSGTFPSGGGGASAAGVKDTAAAAGSSAVGGRKVTNHPGAAVSSNSGGGASAGNEAGLSGSHVAHDDLSAAVRMHQVAERRGKRQQLEDELDEAKSSFLMELLEAIVSAAFASSPSASSAEILLDEARMEGDVKRLLPRCALTKDVISFFEEWLGGPAALAAQGRVLHGASSGAEDYDDVVAAAGENDASGCTALRFYHPGLHEWMARVCEYVTEHQQPQTQALLPLSSLPRAAEFEAV